MKDDRKFTPKAYGQPEETVELDEFGIVLSSVEGSVSGIAASDIEVGQPVYVDEHGVFHAFDETAGPIDKWTDAERQKFRDEWKAANAGPITAVEDYSHLSLAGLHFHVTNFPPIATADGQRFSGTWLNGKRYASLTDAVDAAKDGDTIHVYPEA